MGGHCGILPGVSIGDNSIIATDILPIFRTACISQHVVSCFMTRDQQPNEQINVTDTTLWGKKWDKNSIGLGWGI
ncbi:hypothetical protein KQI74_06630 [Paenibacillus barcinonensis]|nr:hypothetical protein [Paenibacillus barcinonensis]